MTNFSRLIAILTAVMLIAACSGDSAVSPDVGANAGSFTLRTFNAHALPDTVTANSTVLVVTGGTFIAAPDGTYLDILNFMERSNSVTTIYADTAGGTWTARGTTGTFTDVFGTVMTGQFSGSTFQLSENGNVLLYSK